MTLQNLSFQEYRPEPQPFDKTRKQAMRSAYATLRHCMEMLEETAQAWIDEVGPSDAEDVPHPGAGRSARVMVLPSRHAFGTERAARPAAPRDGSGDGQDEEHQEDQEDDTDDDGTGASGPTAPYDEEQAVESIARGGGSGLARYLSDVRALKRMEVAEEVSVCRAVRCGDAKAKAHLVLHNLGLVVAIARTYLGRGLPLDDLIEEGNLGLIEATTRFDPERGVRFSTYARWWVRQAIGQALLNQSRTVRLPVNVVRDVTQVLREHRRDEQSVDVPGGGACATSRLARIASHTGKAVEHVAKLLGYADGALSTDAQVAGESDLSYGDTLPAPDHDEPEARLASQESLRVVFDAIATLSAVEATVIRRRYGFVDGVPSTLREVGLEVRLTTERVRQIQNEALAKLRGELQRRGHDAAGLLAA